MVEWLVVLRLEQLIAPRCQKSLVFSKIFELNGEGLDDFDGTMKPDRSDIATPRGVATGTQIDRDREPLPRAMVTTT